MSWFPDRMGLSLAELPETNESDAPAGSELAPGVLVERRRFLLAGGAALLGVSTASAKDGGKTADAVPEKARSIASFAQALSFEEFVDQARPLAKPLVRAARPNEDAYLHQLASLLSRLRPLPEAAYRNWSRGMAFDPLYRFLPLVVVWMKLEPNAKIPLHDHRDYNGILFGAEGEARVRNFDFVDPARALGSSKPFQVRETASCVLTAGRCSTLSRRRDNLHEIVAGKEGARLMDVFTFFSRDGRSYDLDLSDKPLDGKPDVYEVSWK
jgi:hypothetical protein